MFLVCLVLNEVFLIVCCNTPNPTKKATYSQTFRSVETLCIYLQSIIEKFHRNPKKAANDDIFMRTFTESKISIVYHTDDKCITYSTCEFLKSPTWTDTNAPNIEWNPDSHTSFQVKTLNFILRQLCFNNKKMNILFNNNNND